jgi:hypothetical protein
LKFAVAEILNKPGPSPFCASNDNAVGVLNRLAWQYRHMNPTEHNGDAALTEMFGQSVGWASAAGDDADPDQIGWLVQGNRVHAAVHKFDLNPG